MKELVSKWDKFLQDVPEKKKEKMAELLESQIFSLENWCAANRHPITEVASWIFPICVQVFAETEWVMDLKAHSDLKRMHVDIEDVVKTSQKVLETDEDIEQEIIRTIAEHVTMHVYKNSPFIIGPQVLVPEKGDGLGLYLDHGKLMGKVTSTPRTRGNRKAKRGPPNH